MQSEIDFYFKGKIFFYSARFEKQHSLLSTVTPQYCTIHNEKLIELVYEKRRGRKILEDKDKCKNLSNLCYALKIEYQRLIAKYI